MKKKIITAVLGICLTTTAFGGILTTQAGGLSSILGGAAKIGGIGIVINKFGPQIDSVLNKLLKQNKNFGKNTNFKLLQLFFKILLTFPTSSLHEGNETIIHPKK